MAANITLNIPDNASLHKKQVFQFEAAIDAGAGQLSTGSMLNISKAVGVQLVGGNGNALSVPVTIDQTNKQKGTASFQVVVGGNPPFIHFDMAINQEKAITHTFKPASAATVETNGSTQQIISVAPDKNQTPTNSQYTIQYTAKVTDDTGAAVQNYIIDWLQVSDFGLFDKTKIFIDATGGTYKTIKPIQNDPLRKTSIIRTATDANGNATIYIVATTQAVTAQLQLFENGYDSIDCSQLVIVDLQDETLGLSPATPEGTFTGDALNLSSIQGPDVLVNIQPYPNARDGDTIFVFFNKIYSSSFVWNTSIAPSYPAFFPKINAYTDTGTNAGKLNDLRYVVATGTGLLRTSESTAFKCIGAQGENKPLPHKIRNLPAPQVEDASDFVNADTIKNGLNIDINLTDLQVLAKKDDIIIVSIYLNGYDNDGNEIHHKYQSPKATLSDSDINNRIFNVKFNKDTLLGYNSSPEGNYGAFYAEYTLTRKATGKTGLSEFVEKLLDTVAPGNI
ncbi:hypothetical protein [Brucella oryzae]|uniref:Uncharacterized protein n=1 Tax=Brucella oryzae TaxID=335286 RepID=A0A2S7IUD4_9HYPH|nr:hypothetical protein [Brucella oryzae]PQA71576.1 hypothetical protein C3731_21260 [Brucella oryzae]